MPIRIKRGAIGVLSRGGEHLVVRRADHLVRGGCWCFPGGHLERGENSRIAIRREMAEELGVEVEPVMRLGSVRIIESGYVLAVWRLRLVRGTITPNPDEVAEARWLSPAGIRGLSPTLASNDEVLAMLEETSKRRNVETSKPD